MFKKIFNFALGIIVGNALFSTSALFIMNMLSPTSLSNIWIISGIVICSTLPLAIFFLTKSAEQYVAHVINIYQKIIYYTAIPGAIAILYFTPITALQKITISITGLILSFANIYYLEKIKDENNYYMYFYLAQITIINLLSLKFILEGQIFSASFISSLIIFNNKKFFNIIFWII